MVSVDLIKEGSCILDARAIHDTDKLFALVLLVVQRLAPADDWRGLGLKPKPLIVFFLAGLQVHCHLGAAKEAISGHWSLHAGCRPGRV